MGLGVVPLAVGLVDHEEDRSSSLPEARGERRVLLGDAGCRIRHEQHEVGLLRRSIRLVPDEPLDPPRPREIAARVDQGRKGCTNGVDYAVQIDVEHAIERGVASSAHCFN